MSAIAGEVLISVACVFFVYNFICKFVVLSLRLLENRYNYRYQCHQCFSTDQLTTLSSAHFAVLVILCKGLDTCYSAAYMSQTRNQQRFTNSEVAADWHESMVPQRIM